MNCEYLVNKAYGCLLAGLIGDAMGTPTEGMHYSKIAEKYGWVDDFEGDGTDDSLLKYLLCDALLASGGHANADDWAQEWLANSGITTGAKADKFFISVKHLMYKLSVGISPREACIGNLPSSSSAMCIAPVGIVNMLNPRQAAAQATELGTLIHQGNVSFCQDGAAVIAAAIAEAFKPDATVLSILHAATCYLKPISGREMRNVIGQVLGLAQQCGNYEAFRAAFYEHHLQVITCDSRETVPATLALFYLSEGDPERVLTNAANFGRDADTIATMAGAIAGAFRGVDALPACWLEKSNRYALRNQQQLASDLVELALSKARDVAGLLAHLK